MADSASAPAPAAPATAGERRRPTAAPGPIELSDEKTVQTLATPDSFGAPMARLSPSPTGHGYGSTPPSASTARLGAKPFLFFAPDSGTLDHTGAADSPRRGRPRRAGLRRAARAADGAGALRGRALLRAARGPAGGAARAAVF